jgi:hypothetical protein
LKTHEEGKEMRNMNRIIFEKCGGKRPLRTPRHRWEDDVSKEIGHGLVSVGFGYGAEVVC